ncbi:MAG: fused MFS/spermidine synthase [Candidatus Omnitrophica bacterium]|nr:fused MFS/spermidine synthase [Candidatus Omnitrophota bacterium]
MRNIHLFQIITFLAAFLLFQIELIIAKVLLPHYGGTYLVWGACVVFFQGVLLLGYMFTHLGIQKWGMTGYRYIHTLLVFLPLFFFPGQPLQMVSYESHWPLVFDVFGRLLITIGPAFFVLSTMSIVWQQWLADSSLPERSDPYILFSASNLGSFVALLSYPLCFEYFFDVQIQQNIWRIGYLTLIAFHLFAFKKIPILIDEKTSHALLVQGRSSDGRGVVRWLLYSAAGVMLFLASTNLITIEIAPVPLLWVLPLAIYLLSFVLNFKCRPWMPRWMIYRIDYLLAFSILIYFLMLYAKLPVLVELSSLLFLLFSLCMFCQYQLYQHKPVEKNSLTFFYFMISLGGFLGGILVTWIIPLLSTGAVEYLLGLLVICLALLLDRKMTHLTLADIRWIMYAVGILIIWPIAFPQYHALGFVFLILIFPYIISRVMRNPYAMASCMAIIVIIANPIETVWTNLSYVYKHRNYYGVQKVFEENGVRYLLHGTTIHGGQFIDEARQPTPITYFSMESPVGKLLSSPLFHFQHIAIEGLGIGTLSAYLSKNQTLDYFELDPDVYSLANEYFTFLKNSRGEVHYFFGDARLEMAKRPQDYYDLLIMDAFGGDSVPVHLVTVEALEEGRQHLRKGGILLFHMSNRYIFHGFALAKTAMTLDAYVCQKSFNQNIRYLSLSSWMAVTWDRDVFHALAKDLEWLPFDAQKFGRFREWKDQYSSILPYVSVQELFSQAKEFDWLVF